MGYPNVIYGDYGDEKVAQSTAIGSLPLGQLMILPDGRKFRHAQCGSAAAVTAGCLVATSAGLPGDGCVSASGLLAGATTTHNVIGATAVHLAASLLAITKDQYADGFLNVQLSAGLGHVYRIKSNASAASVGGDIVLTLYPEDGLKVAFAAGSTACSLRRSPYKEAILQSTSAAIAPVMGVTPTAVSASFYFWVQRGGPASVLTAGTAITDGAPVVCSSVTSGSTMPATSAAASTDTFATSHIGVAMETTAAAQGALVNLTIEP